MESQLLRTFVVAARTQNFRKAAEIRFVSQTTVTQQIRKLEEDLGVHLFDRNGRQVRLNPAGTSFLRYAEDLLGLEESAFAAVRSYGHEDASPLRVAVAPHVGQVVLPALLADFIRSSPAPISLLVRPSDEIPSLLREGQADFGLTRQRPDGETLKSELLAEEPLLLVAPLLAGSRTDWHALLERNLLLTHGPKVLTQALLAALDLFQVHPRTMEVQDVAIARAFVKAGIGVTFLPKSAADGDVEAGSLKPVAADDLTLPADTLWAVSPHAPRDGVQDLARFIRDALDERWSPKEER